MLITFKDEVETRLKLLLASEFEMKNINIIEHILGKKTKRNCIMN